ncbi:MAG TPA: biotin/lipoyl-containing protein, partial [Massilibacterium sp.]|nr:biotin/lipoyl-containing protein [Massilibacterium sp.]
ETISRYWDGIRKYYHGFESSMIAPHTEVYQHEMPGGQYSNLEQQAKAVGLRNRFQEVKEMYHRVNLLFGDIVKVTPSSKVVGDMALFMVQNHLREQDILEKGHMLDFPNSVVEFFQGYLGQPYGGFPQPLQQIILKGKEPLKDRPGKTIPAVDFKAMKELLSESLNREATSEEVISYALYEKVFVDFTQVKEKFGDLSVLDTPTFFYGMRLGEELQVKIEEGKTLLVKLVAIGQPQVDGTRVIYFEMNGQPREVTIKDKNIQSSVVEKRKAIKTNPHHIGASMPGTVLKVLVSKGEEVKSGEHLLITEAMKMETTVQAPFDGIVKAIYVQEGESIVTGDLLIEMEE